MGSAGSSHCAGTFPRTPLPSRGPDPCRYAADLIELIRRVEQRRSALLCAGKVAIGVAAYPAQHPESPSVEHDVEVLLAKQHRGADFAITQVFFHADQYKDLVVRARRAGVSIPIIPGGHAVHHAAPRQAFGRHHRCCAVDLLAGCTGPGRRRRRKPPHWRGRHG